MKIQVVHTTDYQYSDNVSQSVNRVCLTPRQTAQQTPLSTEIQITPQPTRVDTVEDMYGNAVSYFTIGEPHRRFTVSMTSTLLTSDLNEDLPVGPSVDTIASSLTTAPSHQDLLAVDCLLPSHFVPTVPAVDDIIEALGEYKYDALVFAQKLMEYVFTNFKFDPNFSTLVTPITAVLEAKRGVCQDFAHLCIAVLRRVGIPTRYVSGYLETLPPPGQQKLQGADASHAWFSVYMPSMGWYDFDPTNNKRPDKQYVTTAWGRDYADIAPLKGVVYGGGTSSLKVAVDVNRIEAPNNIVQ